MANSSGREAHDDRCAINVGAVIQLAIDVRVIWDRAIEDGQVGREWLESPLKRRRVDCVD